MIEEKSTVDPSIVRSQEQLQLVLLLSTLLLTAFGIYFMVWTLVQPYPIYSRENADSFTTIWLLKGHNPFSLDLRPAFLDNYGIVYSLVVYPFALIWGPSLIVHRAVADTFIVLSCGVLFWGMRISRIPTRLACFGAFLYFNHVVYNDICGAPDSLGLFFMFLSLVIPYSKNFSYGSVLVGLLFACLGYFTKAYFVLGAPVLISYLFCFKSKQIGLLAGFIFGSMMSIISLEVGYIFPLYFSDTFYNHYSEAGHSVRHLFHVGIMYFPMGVSLVIAVIWGISQQYRRIGKNLSFRPLLDFLDLKKPLVLYPQITFVTYMLFAFGSVYVFKMGLHGGNALGYVYHIVTPFLIWRACIVAGVEFSYDRTPLRCFQATVVFVAASVCIPMFFRQRDQTNTWRHIKEITLRYNDVLNTGAIAGVLWEQRKPIYDSGQAEYCKYSFTNNPLTIAVDYKNKYQEFEDEIDQKVKHHKFDAVIIFGEAPHAPPVSLSLLAQYYHKVESFPIGFVFEDYQLEVWEPNLPDTDSPGNP